MKRALAALCVGLLPGTGWSQVLLEPVFQVNVHTTGYQLRSSVATDGAGSFVVVWTSGGQDGDLGGVFGRQYTASGGAGAEFPVNDYTTGNQTRPRVALDPLGNFVVVWEGRRPGGIRDIWARRFDASGARQGAEFRVNEYTTYSQLSPAVAADGAGGFVVVWGGIASAGSAYDVWAQRYSAAGVAQGNNFRVNEFVPGSQHGPAVAADDAGRFVVAWQDYNQDGSGSSIFGRRFDAAGAPLTAEFAVNAYTTGSQQTPALAVLPGGTFMVAWADYGRDGSSFGVYGQMLAASGARQGSDFRVSSFTQGSQEFPALTADAAGNFVVAWSGPSQSSYYGAITARRYDSTGAPLGPEFEIYSSTTGGPMMPSLAADPGGTFLATWASQEDGDSFGAFGRRVDPDWIFGDGFE